MLSSSSNGKHAQYARPTPNVKDYLPLEQVPVVIHCISICECTDFVL